MKYIFLLFLLPISSVSGYAQMNQVATGPKFEEPEKGAVKIVQLKNGGAVYFFLPSNPKDNADLRVYDGGHVEKITTSFNLGIERVKEASKELEMIPGSNINQENLVGVFEVNGELVIVIVESTRKKSDVYSITIDLNAGKVKEVKNIFTTVGFLTGVIVRKSETDDSYAIRIWDEIICFNATNQQVARVSFHSPMSDQAHVRFYLFDMLVLGEGQVYVFFKAYDGKPESTAILYMGSLMKGASEVNFTKLKMPVDQVYNGGFARYNSASKKFIFLTAVKMQERGNGYFPVLNMIDPLTLKVDNIDNFGINSELNTRYKAQYEKKNDYAGIPEDVFFDKEGSMAIVYEEIMIQGTSSGSYTREDTKLGKMAIVKLDKTGKFLSNCIIPKSQWILFTRDDMFYHTQQKEVVMKIWRGNQYKSFFYISGVKGNYLLFNDTQRNDEVKGDKFVDVQGVADCNAYIYKISPGLDFPQRDYLFGKPEKGNTLLMFLASDYNPATNTLVTLKLAKESARDKDISMVWLHLE
jgi:hypothetical protein